MKSIEIRCLCGSQITFTDQSESYINPKTNSPDKNGDRFVIEARAREWLQLHMSCVDTKNQVIQESIRVSKLPKARKKSEEKGE